MLYIEICEIKDQNSKVNTRITLLNGHQALKKKKSSSLDERTRLKYPLDIAMNYINH